MANQKINFTKEHLDRLNELSLKALKDGITFKGLANSEINIFNLYHTVTIKTVDDLNKSLKKTIDAEDNNDDWSQSDYQIRKVKELKEKQELVNLIVGYRKYQDQVAVQKAILKDKKDELKALQESLEKPEDKIKKLMAEIEEQEKVVG